MKKIAFIFPRFTGPYGGERLVLNLAKNLSDSGNDITVFTHRADKKILSDLQGKFGVVEGWYPPIKNHQMATFLDLILMPLLAKKINRRYDLVVLFGWQSLFCAYLLKKIFSRGFQRKIIYYCLEPPRFIYDLERETVGGGSSILKKIFFNSIKLTAKTIDRISMPQVDEVISISGWTSRQVKKIYGRDSIIVEPGIETKRFSGLTKSAARKKLKIPPEQKIYISVSKLHRRKRLDKAIDVFKKKGKKEDAFFIIGDGPDKLDVERAIEKSALKNIFLLGRLPDESVSLYMKASDYFIFTAKNEPFGIAPLEAKIAGCKIVPGDTKYRPVDWKQAARKNEEVFEKLYENN